MPLVGRHLAEMLPDAAEGHLLDQYPGMFGVMPDSEQGHEHHISKRAPARYGYRGYNRGYRGRGGGGNRGRNKVSHISLIHLLKFRTIANQIL